MLNAYFVRIDPLTVLLSNTFKKNLINLNIVLYHVFFIKYLCISKIWLVSIGVKWNNKRNTLPFNPIFPYY